MTAIYGIDVGNYDIKSSHTATPSGYIESKLLPPSTDEYLFYNGTYYIPTEERHPYHYDKTVDERCLIYTLFGLSKEILFRVKEGCDIQTSIDKVHHITLAAGLPPAHFATLVDKTKNYYKEMFGDKIEFIYSGYNYSLILDDVYIYPQDYTAVMMNKKAFSVIEQNKKGVVYAIDIGGMTVDYVTISKGKVGMGDADSIEKGMNKMYDTIIQKVRMTMGHTILTTNIEQVLSNSYSILPDEAKKLIYESANAWAETIVASLKAKGMDLWSNPAIFLGGGTLLLKDFLKKNKELEHCVFIETPNVNARAFEKAAKAEKAAAAK